MEKTQDNKRQMHPAMQQAFGQALLKVGMEHADLDWMRQGKKHLKEAAENQAQASSDLPPRR